MTEVCCCHCGTIIKIKLKSNHPNKCSGICRCVNSQRSLKRLGSSCVDMVLLFMSIIFENRPPKLCLLLTHTCKQKYKQMPTLGCNRERKQIEESRQITGLDELHFSCDHEFHLDVQLVFFCLFTTAAIDMLIFNDKMMVFQNISVLKFCMKYCWVGLC